MARKARGERPDQPPVEHIELPEKHSALRWAAAIIFLVIAAASLAYGFNLLVSGERGWREIEVISTGQASCADEFVFLYNVGAGETAVSQESRALSRLYTEAAVNAYQIFHAREGFDGVHNLFYLNAHPNEAVTVDPALYRAFAIVAEYENRTLYLGPLYEIYNGVFTSENDTDAAAYDPARDPSLGELFSQLAAYARDPAAIDVELLGEDQVRLNVSQAYLDFIAENELHNLIDFYWMKNAFITDYLADAISGAGYTYGAISSYDGFSRNLDDHGTDYSLNVYDRRGRSVITAAVMEYVGPLSLVQLRDYPATAMDVWHYRAWGTGEVSGPYLGADGMPKPDSGDGLTCYSREPGCARVLLEAFPSYFDGTYRERAVSDELLEAGIYSLYCVDGQVCYNDASLTPGSLYTSEDSAYEAVLQ